MIKLKIIIILLFVLIPIHNLLATNTDIIFTEIMYDLEGTDSDGEWVEIYNNSSQEFTIDSQWRFYDGSNHLLEIVSGDDIFSPQEVIVIVDDVDVFKQNNTDFQGTILDSVVNLNNSGEEIKLSIDNGENWITEAQYNSDMGANGNGYSLEMLNSQWQEINYNGSPGVYNSESVNNEQEHPSCSCEDEFEEENSTEEEQISNNNQPTPPAQQPLNNLEGNIIISEILPDPEGSDSEGEFIELYNAGSEKVNLTNWYISDNKDNHLLSKELEANQYLLINREDSGISLNNSDGDTISLFNPVDSLKYSISYDKSRPNQSYAFDGALWQWTNIITPGRANEFAIVDDEPMENSSSDLIIDIQAESYYIGQKIKFIARTDLIGEFEWFINEEKLTGKEVDYAFLESGSYNVQLSFNNDQSLINTSTTIEVEELIETTTNNLDNPEEQIDLLLISELKDLPKNTEIKTLGIVTVEPNIFSQTYFYVSEINEMFSPFLSKGIQIYNAKKLFPELKQGDIIEIKGVMSETGGEKRVKISQPEDILVISNMNLPTTELVITGEINDDYEGGLITIQGDLVDKKSSSWYIDDDSGEVRVYINSKAPIEKPEIKVADTIMITGVVSETKSGFRILPRSTNDIKVETILENENVNEDPIVNVISKQETINVAKKESNEQADDYINYSLGIVGLSFVSWFVKLRFFA